MFSDIDKIKMISSNTDLRLLFSQQRIHESSNPDGYGVTNSVPIIFFDSFKRGGNEPIKISKTPHGKVIFPGHIMMNLVDAGILYRSLHLEHRSTTCITRGIDYRTETYWKYLAKDEKIRAIKEYRAMSGGDLREAKQVADDDIKFAKKTSLFQRQKEFLYGVKKSIPGSVTSQPDLNQLQIEIDSLIHEKGRHLIEKNNLETELKEVYNKFITLRESIATDYVLKEKSINVWEIIDASPEENIDSILLKTKKAITLYHPDKISCAGKLLVSYANEIIRELVLFKKIIERKK